MTMAFQQLHRKTLQFYSKLIFSLTDSSHPSAAPQYPQVIPGDIPFPGLPTLLAPALPRLAM